MSSTTICPACGQKEVFSRFNWRAILYAIFCFPCGFYCCLKRKTYYCNFCNCDVVAFSNKETQTQSKMGYSYRLYDSTETGISPVFYRNTALTCSSIDTNITSSSTSPIIS